MSVWNYVPKQLWKCDICGTSFDNEAAAIACERQGKPTVKIGDNVDGGQVTSIGSIQRDASGKHYVEVTVKKQVWVNQVVCVT